MGRGLDSKAGLWEGVRHKLLRKYISKALPEAPAGLAGGGAAKALARDKMYG